MAFIYQTLHIVIEITKHTLFPCSTNWKLSFCRTVFCSIRRRDG